eukprot:RCo007673
MGNVTAVFAFAPPAPSYNSTQESLVWIDGRLPAVYERYDGSNGPPFTNPKYTLLFSHGNAEDLGMVHAAVKIMSRALRVDVLCYEYRGYGLYPGKSSERQCYRDIQTAYDYLVRQVGVPWTQVVLFGCSLGSGPTVHLAAGLGLTANVVGSGCRAESPSMCGGPPETILKCSIEFRIPRRSCRRRLPLRWGAFPARCWRSTTKR